MIHDLSNKHRPNRSIIRTLLKHISARNVTTNAKRLKGASPGETALSAELDQRAREATEKTPKRRRSKEHERKLSFVDARLQVKIETVVLKYHVQNTPISLV